MLKLPETLTVNNQTLRVGDQVAYAPLPEAMRSGSDTLITFEVATHPVKVARIVRIIQTGHAFAEADDEYTAVLTDGTKIDVTRLVRTDQHFVSPALSAEEQERAKMLNTLTMKSDDLETQGYINEVMNPQLGGGVPYTDERQQSLVDAIDSGPNDAVRRAAADIFDGSLSGYRSGGEPLDTPMDGHNA